jgi:hypothetical protein
MEELLVDPPIKVYVDPFSWDWLIFENIVCTSEAFHACACKT